MRTELLVALILAGHISAQATTITAPPGYVARAGNDWCEWPFRVLKQGRLQFGDPSMVQHGKKTLTKLEYRSSVSASYNTFSGLARTYASITLAMGHTDCSKMTSLFSRNYKSPATILYSAKTKLTKQGTSKGKWGEAGSFPFFSSFAYNGKDHLLMEWFFLGGKLQNGWDKGESSYFLDGLRTVSTLALAPNGVHGKYVPRKPQSAGRCSDSAQRKTADARAVANTVIYCDNYHVTSRRGKYSVQLYTFDTRVAAPVIGLLSVGGSESGIPVGWRRRCNNVHANPGFPLLVTRKTAGGTGTATHYNLSLAAAPYKNSWAGTELYWQGAWEDSDRKSIGLTLATKHVLPRKAFAGITAVSGCMVYDYLSGSIRRGPAGPIVGERYNAIERFTTK